MRDLQQRVEEAKAKGELGDDLGDSQEFGRGGEGEDMKINIDSPVTTEVHHHYSSPSIPTVEPTSEPAIEPAVTPEDKAIPELPTPVSDLKKPAGKLMKAAIVTALLASGAGGVAIPAWALGMFNGGNGQSPEVTEPTIPITPTPMPEQNQSDIYSQIELE